MHMYWLGATSIVGIMSGALCRYPRGYRTGEFRVSQLLDIAQDHCLSQVVNINTREDKTLDLLLTNSPSPVNRLKGMPRIGKADHDIVYVEYDIKAKRIQQAPRKIFLYNRADRDGLRDHLAQFRDTFLSSDHSHVSK